tara:strand:- start:246 stop:398 length:153 start_codon:yes stop_codon:yes gene_type:complete
MILKRLVEEMIGSNGSVDGNIKLMPLEINNGRKTAINYLERMVMVGGGLK